MKIVDCDPDGRRLPIKLDSTSNGEFAPIPLDETLRRGNALAAQWAGDYARRLGQNRRAFLKSACGAASTLLAFNAAHAAAGRTGGFFQVAQAAALDAAAADESLAKREFIFDVQGHFVNPTGAWTRGLSATDRPLADFEKASCELSKRPGTRTYLGCLNADEFIKDVFMDSDTDLMVLSFVPSARDAEPLTIEEAAATREIVARLEGSKRLLLHGRVNPNQPGDVEDMERLAGFGIAAYKTYTQWGPQGIGYWLTDDIGLAFIEKARALGVRNICIHKGLPLGQSSYEHSTCRDIGPVARQYPDMNFLIYHSGYVAGRSEGPYDATRSDGIDALVTSLRNSDIAPNSNVYAELGSTWRFLSTRDPTSAAHGLGKLLRYAGEDNVLWGTDSIWYGSPQDQIQALRTFQIAPALRERHGYPEMTARLRQKIFGLNATRPYRLAAEDLRRHLGQDAVAHARQAYATQPNPSFATHGPRTRREFLHLARLQNGAP